MGVSYHDGKVFIIDTVVVDGWFKKVGVFFEPELC